MCKSLGILAFAILAIPALAGDKKDIVDTAAGADNFKTLVAAVKAAGLVETLKGEGPFTVLAPTDEAFAKLPEGTVESLLKPENKDKLVAILKYHVIPAKAMAADVIALGRQGSEDRRGELRQDRREGRLGHDQRGQGHQDGYRVHQRRDPRHRRGDPAAVREVIERSIDRPGGPSPPAGFVAMRGHDGPPG